MNYSLNKSRKDIAMYKIIYFLDQGEEFGGAVNTLLQQALLMLDLEHRIKVVFSNAYGNKVIDEYLQICNKADIEVDYLPYKYTSHTEGVDIVSIFDSYQIIKNYIISNRPDIVHSVQINPVVELISRELDIPHIMNVYPALSAFFSIKYLDTFPHYHICDSYFWANVWKENLLTDSTCIRTVAKRITTREGFSFDTDFIRFICVGTIYEEKNQLEVIKGFESAVKKGVKGYLSVCGHIGSLEYASLCRQYICEHKLSDVVAFKGFCSDMALEYSKNDVLICGSTRESYPNVISEALANYLIVISTPVGGVPEIIKDCQNGYITDGYSAENICDKILEINKDIKSGRIKQVFHNADMTYNKVHSPEAVTHDLLEYYKHVIDTGVKESDMDYNTLKNIFAEMTRLFRENENYFCMPELVRERLWYLYHVSDILVDKAKICSRFYIWGTGKLAKVTKEILDIFCPQIKLNGFISSSIQGKCMEYPIYMPDRIFEDAESVTFIAAKNSQKEIIRLLEEKGKEFNKDYFLLVPRVW